MARCEKNGCFENCRNPSWQWEAFHYPHDEGDYTPPSSEEEVTAQ
jgi:hypothetical protein